MSVARGPKPLPGIFISKEEVNQRVKNYLGQKHPILSKAIDGQETKSAWYSLEQFEELMREMYYLNADGMRIYFGAYAKEDPNYPGMLTVIFVPTHFNPSTGKHADIVIDDDQNFAKRREVPPALVRQVAKNLDTLGLCPPACDTQEFSYPY